MRAALGATSSEPERLDPLRLERAAIESVERQLRQGEPLLAYNAVQEGLNTCPQSLRLRQLKGLAVARSGDTERANRLLAELAAEGNADAETLGMLARTHKDLAVSGADPARRAFHRSAAFRIYHQAYETARREGADADALYTGINAAAMAALDGELVTARRLAEEVRRLCCPPAESSTVAADEYWREATLGEAALILGDAAQSMLHYARAAALARGRFGDLGSTRRQAELLAEQLTLSADWIPSVLSIPPVAMYAGSLGEPEESLAAALHERIVRAGPVAAYGSALTRTDILWLEALRDLGVERHVVLPFPAEECRRIGIDTAAGAWAERFEHALAAADSITVCSDHRARGSAATFEYADLVLTGMARLRARVLRTELAVLRPPGLDAAPLSRERPLPREPLPPGFRHETRALLFADAVGYSALSEDQTVRFITEFLSAIAELNARTTSRPEHIETTGDGLYIVFGSVRDAGEYAIELRTLVSGTDWTTRGLPGGLSIRIALHCGPVYCGRNPVTGTALYTGPHVSRTARIEPITPPGQVYASSAFAAVACATGVEALDLRYVGRIPLAKGHGLLGLYHVSAAARPGGPPG